MSEDETIVTQKPCIRKSMSFEGEQQKIRHNGSRKRFSMYISMLWPEQNLMYEFYDRSNSTNTINHLENLRYIMKNNGWKRIVLVWDNASYHISKMTREYINRQKDWLTVVIHLPKRAPYLNPNERKVNQKIKSDVCANRFYTNIEEQKDAISEYLDKRFGRWFNDICDDT
ncbi:MAG: transposase [Nitrososphaeraceae archaeon]